MLLLKEAVLLKKIVRLQYSEGIREIEPYAIGLGRNEGEILLRAYQLTGPSEFNKSNWKLFRIDSEKMGDVLEIIDNFSQIRDGYVRGDKAMTRIIAEV